MTKNKDEDLMTLITDILKRPKIQTQIIQEKASAREQLIARLTSLFAISFERASKRRHEGGPPIRQKWFSISASLAHSLARLVTDLEYEKLRLDVDDLMKKMFEDNVPSQRITIHQSQNGTDAKPMGKQGA